MGTITTSIPTISTILPHGWTPQTYFPNAWISDPTESTPLGPAHLSQYWYANPTAAATMAAIVGGVVAAYPGMGVSAGDPDQPNQPNLMIVLPNGGMINAGQAILTFFNFGPSALGAIIANLQSQCIQALNADGVGYKVYLNITVAPAPAPTPPAFVGWCYTQLPATPQYLIPQGVTLGLIAGTSVQVYDGMVLNDPVLGTLVASIHNWSLAKNLDGTPYLTGNWTQIAPPPPTS